MASERIRVAIADDHAILRSGLRMLINSQPDMQVVAEAADGDEAVRHVQRMHPDVALVDLTMPRTGGIRAIEQIGRLEPAVRVLVLTMHDDVAYLRSVLAAGASGYVLKKSVDADLLSAIRVVHGGGTFLDPRMAAALDDRIRPRRQAKGVLSNREMKVLQMVAHGHTSQQIADKMAISVKTVETYRARIARKLGLKTRRDLVRYALDLGLLTPEKAAAERAD